MVGRREGRLAPAKPPRANGRRVGAALKAPALSPLRLGLTLTAPTPPTTPPAPTSPTTTPAAITPIGVATAAIALRAPPAGELVKVATRAFMGGLPFAVLFALFIEALTTAIATGA